MGQDVIPLPENETEDPFVWMEHSAIPGSGTWVPNNPDVLESHEARGWERQDAPDGAETSRPDYGDSLWIEMVHPEIKGSASVPNGPGVVDSFRERGWVPRSEAEQEQEQTKKTAASKSRKATTEEKE